VARPVTGAITIPVMLVVALVLFVLFGLEILEHSLQLV